MNREWIHVLMAMILGLILPGLMLSAGSAAQTPGTADPTQASATQPTTQPEEQKTVYIPVRKSDGKTQIMELEAYTLGVVLAEMPTSFEPDALKAQAVVARTYALRRLALQDRHGAFAICTDSACCQAYVSEEEYLQSLGVQEDIKKAAQAVQNTAGLVLTYGGKLAEATYFSCSGGRTEDAAAVWGEDIAYLQAVDSPGEEKAENYAGSVHFTRQAFCAVMGRELEGAPESWLGKVSYTAGGGVDMMFIGGIAYSGIQLRQLLGLNSTAFSMTAENGGVTVTTRGKGHRVGMSQYGADAMAAAGNNWREILAHYYPGTVIDKLADIE